MATRIAVAPAGRGLFGESVCHEYCRAGCTNHTHRTRAEAQAAIDRLADEAPATSNRRGGR